MNNKVLDSISIVLILLLPTLFIVSNEFAEADTFLTIYIRSDGSIEPAGAPINRSGDLFKFTDDIYGRIYIERNNTSLYGNGYFLDGMNSHYPVTINNRDNISMINHIFINFGHGLSITEADEITMNDICFTNLSVGYGWGITIRHSNEILIDNITLNNTGNGFFAENCTNVSIMNINGTDMGSMVYLNTINNVTINNCIGVNGGRPFTFIDCQNLMVNNGMFNNYSSGTGFQNCNNVLFNNISYINIGYIAFTFRDARNITFINNTIKNAPFGFYYDGSCPFDNNISIIGNRIENIRVGNGIGGKKGLIFSENTIINSEVGIVTDDAHIIDNIFIHNGSDNVFGFRGKDSIIEKNIFSSYNCTYPGIACTLSENVTIKNNLIYNSSNGIQLLSSNNNIISENKIYNCISGIYSGHGGQVNNSAYMNTISDCNKYGIYITSSNSSVINNIIKNVTYGILIRWADNGQIKNNIVINASSSGIFTEGDNISIKNNDVSECYLGFEIGSYDQCWICNNDIYNNSYRGISLWGISNCTIEKNNISNNPIGINTYFGENLLVINNTLSNNYDTGLNFTGGAGNDFTVVRNTFKNNNYGIKFKGSIQRFLQNNFINNTVQVSQVNTGSFIWNYTYPWGGNYWSDFDEPLEGAYDNNTDGIIDTPYTISSIAVDNQPLLLPYGQNNPYILFNETVVNRTLDIDLIWNIDRDGYIESFDWDFDDGGTAEGENVSHNYSKDGTYNLTVNVTDNDGYFYVANKTVIIKDCPYLELDSSPMIGTTGDTYDFCMKAGDNFGVASVWVEWTHGSLNGNLSLTEIGDYWSGTIELDQSLENLSYIVHIFDPSDNYNGSGPFERIVKDNDRPEFVNDLSPTQGFTGDPYTFHVEVIDFFIIDSVYVEYWFGEGTHSNTSMTESTRGFYTKTIDLPHSLDKLHYIFRSVDYFRNWNNTIEREVTLLDNDRPVFGAESSTANVTTGDKFELRIEITDNIEVEFASVEYWFGEGSHNNISLTSGVNNEWHSEIDIPSNSLQTLFFVYSSRDDADNWGTSSLHTVGIEDNDKPLFGEDLTENTVKAGGELLFSIQVTDNIDVNSVYLVYYYRYDELHNISMTEDSGYWTAELTVEHTLDILHYYYIAEDSSGNWAGTDEKYIQVKDEDNPLLISDGSPTVAYTDKDYLFSFDVEDNIHINQVEVEYWFGDEDHITVSLSLHDDHYQHKIRIPRNSIEPLFYKTSARDSSGNRAQFNTVTIPVFDNIPPTIEDIEDITMYQGQSIYVTAEASDNIAVNEVKWTGGPIPGSGYYLKGIVNGTGLFDVSITVKDNAGNEAETSFSITVLPFDNDRDNDGIPDLIEDKYNMDPDDPSDANKDFDDDGLNNYQEYLNRTHPDVSDTDNDGMPDGWEVQYGLDPTKPSADIDTDGDGISDLQEYKDGTDPTKPEPKDDEEGSLWIYIIIALLIILVLIGAVFFFLKMKMGTEEEEVFEKRDKSLREQIERQPSAELDLLKEKRGGKNER